VPQGGRPPVDRNVYSFEGTFVAPPEVVLDTSFVVDALVTTQSRHQACRLFLDIIAATGSTVYFNNLLVVELWEAAYAIKLRELHGGAWRRHRHDGRTRRPAKQLRLKMSEAWSTALEALDTVVIELGEVSSAAPLFMLYGLSATDAVHAATAAYVDVRPFLTLDHHFSHVPGHVLELWVPQNRVRPCREARRR
jgi:predicted nucleic acid-binding protein